MHGPWPSGGQILRGRHQDWLWLVWRTSDGFTLVPVLALAHSSVPEVAQVRNGKPRGWKPNLLILQIRGLTPVCAKR